MTEVSSVAERITQLLIENLGVDQAKIVESASFVDDLEADSLDTVQIIMAMEEEFGIEIPDGDAEKIQTVGDAIKYVTKVLADA